MRLLSSQPFTSWREEIPVPDFRLDSFGREKLAGFVDEKRFGFDTDGIPSQPAGHRGDDPEAATPLAKQVPRREVSFPDGCERTPYIPKIARDVLLDRSAMPTVPVDLQTSVRAFQHGQGIGRERTLQIPIDRDGGELLVPGGWMSPASHRFLTKIISFACRIRRGEIQSPTVASLNRRPATLPAIFSPNHPPSHPPESMRPIIDRRNFLATSSIAVVGAACASQVSWGQAERAAPFKISLAQWSLHKPLFAKEIDNLDFAKVAKEKFNIEAVEYVNQFFKDKAKDETYLAEMKKRTDDYGVTNVLIMIDGEGALGSSDHAKRTQAIENHYKWVDAAKFLGCHSIRVNAETDKPYEEGSKLAADGLGRLSEYAKPLGINVIVENHGGLSSNGKWLAETIRATGKDNCGTLPDFGNFYEYDRYQGVTDLMPLAKAVSAKSYDFDAQGNETKIDFPRMMKIVLDAGYHSWVGIEYEGSRLSPDEGIAATKKLLEQIRDKV